MANRSGFTIIETMLFLAITGALIAALLGGVNIALNNQRYQDSVQSFKDMLQGDYDSLTNVQNDRDSGLTCNSSAQVAQSGTPVPIGQSNCFLVGLYVTIVGQNVTTTDVVGVGSGGSATGDDITLLKGNYNLGLSSTTTQATQLEWGTEIAWPSSGSDGTPAHDPSRTATTPRSIAILLIRSPDSGTTYTFTSDTVVAPTAVHQSDLMAMLVEGNVVPGQGDRLVCLESNGLSTSGNVGIYIDKYATNTASIETRSNENLTNLAGTARC